MQSISGLLASRCPETIRTRILDDREFTARVEIPVARVLEIAKAISIKLEQLFALVRTMLRDRSDAYLVDLNGRNVRLYLDHDAICFQLDGDPQPRAILPELLILSPDPTERTTCLVNLLERYGPTGPDFSVYAATSGERELLDAEISAILSEGQHGVAFRLGRAAAAFRSGSAAVDDLVPNEFRYFELLCGPRPSSVSAETYFSSILPQHRQALLRRQLVPGLEICLLGALRDDLCPGQWLTGISDDELWDGLNRLTFATDPYSLIGALDVAMTRVHDDRFRGAVEPILDRLAQPTLQDDQGHDAYELLPLFARLTAHQLNFLPSGFLCPPYWKRMCAWMHGTMLLRLSRNLGVSAKDLSPWIEGRMSLAGAFAEMLDLRREPMFSSAIMSRDALRGEILGRAMAVYQRHKASGRQMPRYDILEELYTKDQPTTLPWIHMSPGPLEGNQHPKQLSSDVIPKSAISELQNRLVNEPFGKVWSVLAQLSQCCRLGDDLLNPARAALKTTRTDVMDIQNTGLSDAAIVALASSDTELSNALADLLVLIAPKVDAPADAIALLNTIVLAGNNIQDDAEWDAWLEQHLERLSLALPINRTMLQTYVSALDALETFVPAACGLLCKAKAISRAAI